ncbi:type 1 fimbria pilin [Citrobacter amalonaticus]|nr:type 1 fimbria pilin [Citrobacter amalonaticus]
MLLILFVEKINMPKFSCYMTVMLLFFSGLVRASCYPPNGYITYSYNLGITIDVPADASLGPIGDVIDIPPGPAVNVGCDTPGASYAYLQFSTTQKTTSTKDVYATNVPGIGVKVWDDRYNPSTIVGNSGSAWFAGPNSIYAWSSIWNISNLKMQFYVVGPVEPGDVTLSAPFVNALISSSPSSGGKVYSRVSITGSAHIKVPACDVDEALTPDVVDLHAINITALPHQGDVGNNVDFTISLICNASATINMTLTDPNGGDPEKGVVLNDVGDGMAQNVGVQLLAARDEGATPQTINLNKSFSVGKAVQGQYTIPMAARYYRTSDEAIVGGKISASVIYELSYQ